MSYLTLTRPTDHTAPIRLLLKEIAFLPHNIGIFHKTKAGAESLKLLDELLMTIKRHAQMLLGEEAALRDQKEVPQPINQNATMITLPQS